MPLCWSIVVLSDLLIIGGVRFALCANAHISESRYEAPDLWLDLRPGHSPQNPDVGHPPTGASVVEVFLRMTLLEGCRRRHPWCANG